jgi:hypothetical protein
MVAALCALLLATPAPAAEPPSAPRLAVGVNVLGAQVDYHLTKSVRGELRYVTGSQAAPSGQVSSRVLGARGYRLFGAQATRVFAGAEAAFVTASQKGTSYRVSGPAFGGFVGLERRVVGRLWAGLDAGPYVFSLKEADTRASETSFDFVLNSYLMFYLF